MALSVIGYNDITQLSNVRKIFFTCLCMGASEKYTCDIFCRNVAPYLYTQDKHKLAEKNKLTISKWRPKSNFNFALI